MYSKTADPLMASEIDMCPFADSPGSVPAKLDFSAELARFDRGDKQ